MIFFFSQSCQERNEDTSTDSSKPNVILIMSDDLAMDAAYPTPPLNPELEFDKDFQRQLPSRVLQAIEAKIKLGTYEARASVTPGQKEVTFKVDLEEGDTELQTWLRKQKERTGEPTMSTSLPPKDKTEEQ